jgi:pimeloyl-ACP methyl ester carboxylesterase
MLLTPAAGKRLIGKAIAAHPDVQGALKNGTVVVIAGTTNGYVAEELLKVIGQAAGFKRRRFFRGIVLPPGKSAKGPGSVPDEDLFPGDVVISEGVWRKGKTIYDTADALKENDVIIKGANAVNIELGRAAILIGNPQGGTIGAALPAYHDRHVRMIIPVGLEKRISGNPDDLAALMNQPGAQGLRLWPVPGKVFTEIDAIALLTGARAQLLAAGGVAGAEGGIWLGISGDTTQEDQAMALLQSVAGEAAFEL